MSIANENITIESQKYRVFLPEVLDEKYDESREIGYSWADILNAGDLGQLLVQTRQNLELHKNAMEAGRTIFPPPEKHDKCSDVHLFGKAPSEEDWEFCKRMFEERADAAGEAFWAAKLVKDSIANPTSNIHSPEDPNDVHNWARFGIEVILKHHSSWFFESGIYNPKINNKDQELSRLLGIILKYGDTLHLHGYQKRYVDYLLLTAKENGMEEYIPALSFLAYTSIRNEKIIELDPDLAKVESNPNLLEDGAWQDRMSRLSEHALEQRVMAKKIIHEEKRKYGVENLTNHHERGVVLGENLLLHVVNGDNSAVFKLSRQVPQQAYDLQEIKENDVARNCEFATGLRQSILDVLGGDYRNKIDLVYLRNMLLQLHKIGPDQIDSIAARLGNRQLGLKDLTSEEIAYILISDFIADIASEAGINYQAFHNPELAGQLKELGYRVINLKPAGADHSMYDEGGYHIISNGGSEDLCITHAEALDEQLQLENRALEEALKNAKDVNQHEPNNPPVPHPAAVSYGGYLIPQVPVDGEVSSLDNGSEQGPKNTSREIERQGPRNTSGETGRQGPNTSHSKKLSVSGGPGPEEKKLVQKKPLGGGDTNPLHNWPRQTQKYKGEIEGKIEGKIEEEHVIPRLLTARGRRDLPMSAGKPTPQNSREYRKPVQKAETYLGKQPTPPVSPSPKNLGDSNLANSNVDATIPQGKPVTIPISKKPLVIGDTLRKALTNDQNTGQNTVAPAEEHLANTESLGNTVLPISTAPGKPASINGKKLTQYNNNKPHHLKHLKFMQSNKDSGPDIELAAIPQHNSEEAAATLSLPIPGAFLEEFDPLGGVIDYQLVVNNQIAQAA